MNSNPTISIVIPTYNHAEFLRDAIASILNQTFCDWEAIVVNNFSEDNTEEVIASFKDPRIQLINFHNHGVIASSRNYGIKVAKGEYIAFLDSDDVWYPEKLQRCYEALLASGEDAVCHGERWVGPNSYQRDVVYGPESRGSYKSLLYDGNLISTSAVVVRRQNVLDIDAFCEDEKLVTAEDYDLWLRLTKAGTRFVFLNDMLGEFRIHPGGNSQAVLKNVEAILTVIERQFQDQAQPNWLDFLLRRRARALVLYSGGRTFQRQGQRFAAFRLFFNSMFIFPFVFRLYLAMILGCMPDRLRLGLDR